MEWIEAKDAAEHSSVDRSATVMVNFMCQLDRPRRAQIKHSFWGGRIFLKAKKQRQLVSKDSKNNIYVSRKINNFQW